MRLYHHPISSNSRRPLLVAEHLGIPLDLVEVNLMDPGQTLYPRDMHARAQALEQREIKGFYRVMCVNAQNDPWSGHIVEASLSGHP